MDLDYLALVSPLQELSFNKAKKYFLEKDIDLEEEYASLG